MDCIKIKSSRGFGDCIWEIIGEASNEYKLKKLNGVETISIYKAHCYKDENTIRAASVMSQLKAKAIGHSK